MKILMGWCCATEKARHNWLMVGLWTAHVVVAIALGVVVGGELAVDPKKLSGEENKPIFLLS